MFRIFTISISFAFIAASLYGFYFVLVCENHTLSHSLIAGVCPSTDFVKFLSGWRQAFSGILTEIIFGLAAIFALSLVTRPHLGQVFSPKLSPANWHHQPDLKVKFSFFDFISSGLLKPQIYAA